VVSLVSLLLHFSQRLTVAHSRDSRDKNQNSRVGIWQNVIYS